MSLALSVIKGIDSSSRPAIELQYKGESKYRTSYGGFFTIVSLILFLICIVHKVAKDVNYLDTYNSVESLEDVTALGRRLGADPEPETTTNTTEIAPVKEEVSGGDDSDKSSSYGSDDKYADKEVDKTATKTKYNTSDGQYFSASNFYFQK